MTNLWIFVFCLTVFASVVEGQIRCTGSQFVTYTWRPSMRLILVDSQSPVTRYQNIADMQTCFNLCKEQTPCEGFNYNSQVKECEVLETDDVSKIQGANQWNYYNVACGTTEPETSAEPSSEPEPEMSMDDVFNYFKHHPEYIAMIGMGFMIVLLFITAIVILCCYTGAAARKRSDDYREKA